MVPPYKQPLRDVDPSSDVDSAYLQLPSPHGELPKGAGGRWASPLQLPFGTTLEREDGAFEQEEGWIGDVYEDESAFGEIRDEEGQADEQEAAQDDEQMSQRTAESLPNLHEDQTPPSTPRSHSSPSSQPSTPRENDPFAQAFAYVRNLQRQQAAAQPPAAPLGTVCQGDGLPGPGGPTVPR